MKHKTKGHQRQQELYDAAARLFAEQGFHATSMRQLAQTLGLTKSSLYHYIASKEELLFQILDSYISDALVEIENLVADQTRPPEERLTQFIQFYARFYAGDRPRLVLLVNELDSLPARRRQVLVKKERRYLAVLTGLLAELKESGSLKDMPEAVAAFAFFGMVHYTYKWFRPGGAASPSQLADHFLEIFTRGVMRDA
jgi:AcrR family transcriptional regulator